MAPGQHISNIDGLQGAAERRATLGPQRVSPQEIAAFAAALEQITSARYTWGRAVEQTPTPGPTRAKGMSSLSALSFLAVGMQHFTALPLRATATTLPSASSAYSGVRPSPYDGLRLGQRDTQHNGAIARLQGTLKKWNPNLDLEVSGRFDDKTESALLLFKAVYVRGRDGQHVDSATAKKLSALGEEATFNTTPARQAGSHMLYAVSKHLGQPSPTASTGDAGTDNARLIAQTMVDLGLAEAGFATDPAGQYLAAQQGQNGLFLVGQPRPGDLVFFHPTPDETPASSSVTDSEGRPIRGVALFVGDQRVLAVEAGGQQVALQPLGKMAERISGFARCHIKLAAPPSGPVEAPASDDSSEGSGEHVAVSLSSNDTPATSNERPTAPPATPSSTPPSGATQPPAASSEPGLQLAMPRAGALA